MHRFFGALLQLLIFCNFKPVYLRNISHPDCLPGLSENEFAFGGDGYVSLGNKGFEQRKFSQIKFSFKTSMDEGLIYLTATPDGHFESVELRNGKVIYQFQLNSGQVELATERRYDDGKWHVLEVRWTPEDSSSLVIDDSVESVARHPEHFKSLNFKSAAYFGGFKGQHNIRGITAKGFDGSIKDVQLGGASRRLNLHMEMKNAYSGCPRRQRRQTESWPNFHASYIGATNVELRWNTNSYCYDSFLIQWRKLEEASKTDVSKGTNETDVLNKINEADVSSKTDVLSKIYVLNKTVTDYLAEIEELESSATYTFTLSGFYNGKVSQWKNSFNSTTREVNYPSLIVTSVTNSSLSARWTFSESFVVSIAGNSKNAEITNRTSFTFEDLIPGEVYRLKLVDGHTNSSTEREVVTNPNPVYVEARRSGNDIELTWDNTAEVEVMYRRQEEECVLKRLSGINGTIPELAYGCMYQLKTSAVSSGRRIRSNQTNYMEIDAMQAENFSCEAGNEEGEISCDWKQIPSKACFEYQLSLSPSSPYAPRPTSGNKTTVGHLKAGATYSISIVSITKNGNSTSAQTENATAKTGIDTEFFVKSNSTNHHSIELRYLKDAERVIDYYNVTSNENSSILNESSRHLSWKDLEAGHCYRYTVHAVSQDVPSKLLIDEICTVPYRPTSVKCLSDRATNSSVAVAIQKPKFGYVDHYDVDVRAYYRVPRRISHENASGETVYVNITNLRPYTNYTVNVMSAVEGDKGINSEAETSHCQTAQGTPGRIKYFYNRTYGPDRVRMEWPKPDPENGVITHYIIRIDHLWGREKTATMEVEGHLLYCELTTVTAGETYNISICAKTIAGEGPMTSTIVTVKAYSLNALFVALASLLAILFTVLIALLLFYYIRKSPQRMMSIRRMSNRLRNASDQMQMVFPQPTVTSKPVKISQFLECMKFLEKDSGLKFTEEYEDLKYVGRNQSRDEAELQCNRVKNRFTNILPYDISRVKLLPMEDEDGSDYINANWIPGFNSKREFIATQGPLPSTINDFWRMVWENNCQAIVMLTLCIEKGHIKCEQYWPSDKEPVFYGDLKVEIQTETKTDEWTILEFKISLGAQSRKLKHCHYVGWPDMYVPEKKSLIAFVRLIRESINTSGSKGPVVVHCSAGVGRTGTFIALDTLLLHIKEGHDLDIYGIVFQMRMNRVLMVQTEAQYVFIYECLNHVLEHPNGEVVEKTKETASDGGVKTKDSQEEPKEKESEPKLNTDTIQQPDKKEVELKPNSDTREEPDKKELESKPNSDSKEDPSKAALETSSDSNEKKCNNDTVNNPDQEPQKEVAAKQEETNK